MRLSLLASILGSATLLAPSAYAVVNPLVQPPSILQPSAQQAPAAAGGPAGAPVQPPPLGSGASNEQNPLLASSGPAKPEGPPDPLQGLPTATRQQLVAAEVVVIFGNSAVLRVPLMTDAGATPSAGASAGGAPTPVTSSPGTAAPATAGASGGGGIKVSEIVPLREQSLLVQHGTSVWLGLTEFTANVSADRVVLRTTGKPGRVVFVGSIEGTDRDSSRTTESAIAPKTSEYKSRRPQLDAATSSSAEKKD